MHIIMLCVCMCLCTYICAHLCAYVNVQMAACEQHSVHSCMLGHV